MYYNRIYMVANKTHTPRVYYFQNYERRRGDLNVRPAPIYKIV